MNQKTHSEDINITYDEKISIVRKYFIRKGYRVHSGLQFGTHLVLYADSVDKVHSDFCVHILRSDERVDWMTIQTLVRSMPELHKTLILANVTTINSKHIVEELAIATEHAPFRHREIVEVGYQTK